MALNIFNTLSRKIDEFTPQDINNVSMYSCGPTVYNYPHIGNYRAYIFTDMLKRYLAHAGYSVTHVMNITDVDDKTIRDSKAQNKTLKEFAEFYTDEFLKDCDALNILPPTHQPKATESVDGMVRIIEKLLSNGHAYKGADGSIYFDIHKDKEYGKLSRIDIGELKENADGRVTKDEYTKEDAHDFALWKAYDEADGDIYWDTPFGRGRPGWHIECSAMSMDTLGESIDIHTGGVDLIFPHHENEIAQSECSTGKQFVKYFMHNEHLLVDGKKMSKSLGNFYTLRDLMEKGISPLAFRYWLYTGHYRTNVNFTLDTVIGAQKALERLYEAYKDLGDTLGTVDTAYISRFKACMDGDLNTPQAIALIWEILKDTSISDQDKKETLLDFDNVFGFGLAMLSDEVIPENIEMLVEERRIAKGNKDYAKSDELRDKIESLGYKVKDTDTGSKVSKI
jgi:cysteinyl-tRNA synthetase